VSKTGRQVNTGFFEPCWREEGEIIVQPKKTNDQAALIAEVRRGILATTRDRDKAVALEALDSLTAARGASVSDQEAQEARETLAMIRASFSARRYAEAQEYERNLVLKVDALAARVETVKEALHFALSRTTDDPVQYRRIAAALAAVDELARVQKENEELSREAEQHESLKMTVRHVAGSLEGGNTDTDTLAATLRAALAVAGDRQTVSERVAEAEKWSGC
jgi:hypothetical protein